MLWLVLAGVSVVETVGAVGSGSVEDAEANRDNIGNNALMREDYSYSNADTED